MKKELVLDAALDSDGTTLRDLLPSHVSHPAHYNSGKIEVIEAIEDWKLCYHLGNAVKYVARAGKKDPAKDVEDLEKAVWYIRRKIEKLKALKENREVIRPNDMNPKSISVTAASNLKVNVDAWGTAVNAKPNALPLMADPAVPNGEFQVGPICQDCSREEGRHFLFCSQVKG